VEYESRGEVGVWTITDFAAYVQSGEIDAGEEHYREEASTEEMSATVVAIENAEALGREMSDTLERINEEWSQLADDVGIDRHAYVADGMIASAAKVKMEADVETESFGSVEESVEWCKQA
jgi:hypothetical protein